MSFLKCKGLVATGLLISQFAWANPYWDPAKAPKEIDFSHANTVQLDVKKIRVVPAQQAAINVLRIQVDWDETNERYAISQRVSEPSGTEALLARSTHKPKWGSYLGVLKDANSGKALYYDSIGTGKEYRKLARAINLRFPLPTTQMIFELYAEHPDTGTMELVLTENISPDAIHKAKPYVGEVIVKELAIAQKSPSLRVNIYAEGFLVTEQKKFWRLAIKTVESLKSQHFPGVDYMSFYGVFSPSATTLGYPENLGYPVPEYNTFLGLYFPYWDDFGRWYHVLYPTRENKFRQGLAVAPYDYPIVLVDDDGYWGVGNYMSHTAIPADNTDYFTYLLMHEFGHFFGLNEEYEGGGRTELEFAKGIDEPWSQNITFLTNPVYEGLKWNTFVSPSTKLPTPRKDWNSYPPNYGAYKGGYGDSRSSKSVSHKPGLNCIMESHATFCDICAHGVQAVIDHDLGKEAAMSITKR
jgi:hypothetical protein